MELVDRVLAVTGGGDGIGREVVLQLLDRGARVAAIDVRPDALAATVQRAGASTSRLSQHIVDITDRDSVSTLPAAILAAHGQVDGLVHIAGIIQRFVPLMDLTLEEFEHVMAVNFWGAVYLDRAFLPVLMTRPEACLVAVSSMGALVPVLGQGAYSVSKAALKLLTESWYAELRETRVAVTVVFPGGVGTNITANSGVEPPRLVEGAASRVTSAADAARAIVDAVERGSFRVVIGRDARWVDLLSRLAPRRAIIMIADRMRSLVR